MVNIIGALNNNKIIASMVFDGYCNTEVFETYIEECLVPELTPGKTVILDNVSFHNSKKVKILIENAKCTLKFLPTYSPNLNPIEHHWHKIKSLARKELKKEQDELFGCMIKVLKTMS
jgi:transposase